MYQIDKHKCTFVVKHTHSHTRIENFGDLYHLFKYVFDKISTRKIYAIRKFRNGCETHGIFVYQIYQKGEHPLNCFGFGFGFGSECARTTLHGLHILFYMELMYIQICTINWIIIRNMKQLVTQSKIQYGHWKDERNELFVNSAIHLMSALHFS